jgi:hypothetical protein
MNRGVPRRVIGPTVGERLQKARIVTSCRTVYLRLFNRCADRVMVDNCRQVDLKCLGSSTRGRASNGVGDWGDYNGARVCNFSIMSHSKQGFVVYAEQLFVV